MLLTSLSTFVQAQDWKILTDSAKLYQNQRKNDLAISNYLKAREQLVIDSPKTVTLGRLNREIGILYQGQGKYPNAEKYYAESKTVMSFIHEKETEEYFRSCNHLNYLYVLMGKFDTAMKLCLETIDEAQKRLGDKNYEYSRSNRNLGMLTRSLGRFDEAVDYFTRAQSIVLETKGRNTFEYASITNDLGGTYNLMGRIEEALEQLLIAKDGYAASVGKESPSYGSVTNNLGLVYKNMHQYDLSEQYYKEALRVRKIVEGDRTPSVAQASYNLADMYLLVGQFSKAETLLYQAEDIYRSTVTKEHPDYARVCSKLGILYAQLNNYPKADSFLRVSKGIRERKLTRNHPEYAANLWYMAEMFLGMNRLDSAEIYLQEAYGIWRKVVGVKHPEVFNSSLGLAKVFIRQKRFDKAKMMLDEIGTVWDNSGVANSSHSKVQELYGRLYWLQGDQKNAMDYYRKSLASQLNQVHDVFRFMSEPEKVSFLGNIIHTNDEYYSFFTSNTGGGTSSYDLSLAYRELVLSSFRNLQERIFESKDSTLKKNYRKWILIRETLADHYASNQSGPEIKLLEDSANNIEKELIRASPAIQSQLEQITSASISEKLKPSEAAVEFISYNKNDGERWTDSIYYAAIVLVKGKTPEIVHLFEERELLHLVNLTKGSGGGVVQLNKLYSGSAGNQSLYNLVWKPIDQKLQGIKTVYYTPGGMMFRISFAAIPTSADKVLGDRYNLIQMNTTASVATQKQPVHFETEDMVMFGGIQYESDSASMVYAASLTQGSHNDSRALPDEFTPDGYRVFTYLNGSAQEIKRIRSVAGTKYSCKVLSDKLATEEAFKNLSGKNSPAILHIATHGYFFPDVVTTRKSSLQGGASVFRQSYHPLMRSGLAMAGANNAWRGNPVPGVEDGILTAYEVSNMYLPNTKLAVLSACETGLGEIKGSEGVYGLQRAFKMAGVDHLIMSLWKVPDLETAEFMQIFYRNLIARQTIQDSFKGAQQSLRAKYPADPYKWAAWVLIR